MMKHKRHKRKKAYINGIGGGQCVGRVNEGYAIVAGRINKHEDRTVMAIGKSKSSGLPECVTWRTKDCENFYWGHYFWDEKNSLTKCAKDFETR